MPTKIDWSDEMINPLGWGCYGPGRTPENPKPCSYCYAMRIAHRGMRDYDLCRQFIPHWHPEMLDKPHFWKKPRRIFVQSMGDLFHPSTPQFQIELVLAMAKALPRHTFQFLTKNPKRLKDFNPWPANCWVGTTVTGQADADERLPWLLQVEAVVRFVSHEPLLGAIDLTNYLPPEFCLNCNNTGYPWIECGNEHSGYDYRYTCECKTQKYVDWAIIGAQTGPGAVKPKLEWVQGLIDQYRAAGVPLFLKDNLNRVDKIQEFPV